MVLPLGLTEAATDAAILKKIFGPGMTTLIISNEEMNAIMKIVMSLEDAGRLINGIRGGLVEQSKMKQKDKKVDFLACHLVH